jgi:SAM-dependent methyltransferase
MSTTTPGADALQEAVTARYAGLAPGAGSLSCGRALELAAPGPGEVVVDLGCGRGRDVVRAAALVGPEGGAIGVDASEEMLARARSEASTAAPAARFVCSDLAALDLPDGTATVVVSNCAINHAPDKAAVYREVHRVLRPGGRFVVSDVVSEEPLPEAVRRDPEAWAACYGGAIPEADYLAAIRAAGFGEVEILERSAPYRRGGASVRSLTVRGEKP